MIEIAFHGSSSFIPERQQVGHDYAFSRSSLVQTTVFWRSIPVCGLLAARKSMATATEHQTDRGTQAANHVRSRYFFEEPGGKCLNILSTPLSRFLMFFSELLESVSLEEPLQISCLVLVSKRSTTTVPTL
jgi:hypothetical protein